MCLDSLLTKEEFDTIALEEGYEYRIAYKVVDKIRDSDQTIYYRSPFFPDFRMVIGVWVGDTYSILANSDDDKAYEAGIHLFPDKDAAFAYSKWIRIGMVTCWPTVVKVKYARPVAFGYQNGRLSIVAKEVKVLCEEEQDD